MKSRWLSVVSLALLLVFATTALALAGERSYGNFTNVASNYAYHKDFYGTSRSFLYNTSNLVVKYKGCDGVWHTASNPVCFVRNSFNAYNNDSVYWHQEYISKVADQINFCSN